MWSQCRAAGRWSRLKRGWTGPWWSIPNRVIQDTQTSSASCCSGCLKYAALACSWRSICTSAIFWEIYPATLYSLRCCTPSTAEKVLLHLVTQEWHSLSLLWIFVPPFGPFRASCAFYDCWKLLQILNRHVLTSLTVSSFTEVRKICHPGSVMKGTIY